MQAVILAGGLGTRLRPITETVPKPMIPVFGKPFLQYQLELLRSYGIEDIVITVGHLGNMIMNYFDDGSAMGLRIKYSVEERPLGTGGSLKMARGLLDERFFVLYGDSYLPVDYRAVEEAFGGSHRLGLVVAYDNTEDTTVPPNIEIDDERLVRRYEKDSGGLSLVDAGVLAFKKEVLRLMPEGPFSLEKKIFPLLIERGQFYCFVTRQRFYDIGSPDRLLKFLGYLSDHITDAV